jgi:hypothetical protein
MNIDLGSPILDVAIGLSFVFFLLAVIASAVNEAIAGLLNLRGNTLENGLEEMFGSKSAAKLLLDHDLVRTELLKRSRKDANAVLLRLDGLLPKPVRTFERASSYLSPQVFAVAFKALHGTLKGEGKVEVQLKSLGLWESVGDDLGELERWFDSSMERVSGWYKRKSQIFVALIAVAVAVGLNANTILIAKRLDSDPATRTAVVATAEKALEKELAEKKGSDAVAEIEEADEHLTEATKNVAALNVPLFWAAENKPSHSPWETVVFGWLLTVIAISLGAPFWFDALGKLANLRTTGEKPKASCGAAG